MASHEPLHDAEHFPSQVADGGVPAQSTSHFAEQFAEHCALQLACALPPLALAAHCVSQSALQDPLQLAGLVVHVIGGAQAAGELDAKRAIEQGVRLGARL